MVAMGWFDAENLTPESLLQIRRWQIGNGGLPRRLFLLFDADGQDIS